MKVKTPELNEKALISEHSELKNEGIYDAIVQGMLIKVNS